MTVAIIICGVDVLSPSVFPLRGHCLVISIVAGPSQVLNPAHFISFYIYHKRPQQTKFQVGRASPSTQADSWSLFTFLSFSSASLHLLLILQVNFTAPSFEHSYFYFCFLVDLWLPKLIFRQFETCSLPYSTTFFVSSTLKSQQTKLS